MAEVITSEDSNYKVSAANLKNLSATIKKAATKQILLIFGGLKNNPGHLEDFSVKTKGKYLGLFPRYQLVIQPVYLTVTTDQAGMDLSLDDKSWRRQRAPIIRRLGVR